MRFLSSSLTTLRCAALVVAAPEARNDRSGERHQGGARRPRLLLRDATGGRGTFDGACFLHALRPFRQWMNLKRFSCALVPVAAFDRIPQRRRPDETCNVEAPRLAGVSHCADGGLSSFQLAYRTTSARSSTSFANGLRLPSLSRAVASRATSRTTSTRSSPT